MKDYGGKYKAHMPKKKIKGQRGGEEGKLKMQIVLRRKENA